jgi:hypothetical protein
MFELFTPATLPSIAGEPRGTYRAQLLSEH